MKQAKATVKEAEALLRWLQKQENADRQPPPYNRTIFGYLLMLEHCADPAKDYIDFRPGTSPDEIAALKQRAEAAEARVARMTEMLLAYDAERALYLRRLLWLHDCSTGTTDADGYEWGIYRVKWVNGQAVEVWQTNSDFSDLDAAIERDGYKLPASAKALEARVRELEAELKYGTATGEPCAEVVRLTEHNAKLRAALQYAGMKAGTANALAYHAEQGKDNGGVERTALAEWLRALAKDLKAVEAALADTKGTT